MSRSTAIKCASPLTCFFTESFLTDVEPVTHIDVKLHKLLSRLTSHNTQIFDTQIAFYTYNFSIFYFFGKRALEISLPFQNGF